LYFLQGAEQWGVDLAVGVETINGVQLPEHTLRADAKASFRPRPISSLFNPTTDGAAPDFAPPKFMMAPLASPNRLPWAEAGIFIGATVAKSMPIAGVKKTCLEFLITIFPYIDRRPAMAR